MNAPAKQRIRVPARSQHMHQSPLPTVAPSRPQPGAAFMRGEKSPTFQSWFPALRDASDDVKAAWRMGVARSIDSIQNSGWLTGAADQSMASVCGTGLTLSAKPDLSFAGFDEDQTSEWARRTERRFELWANNPRACDARAKFNLGQQGCQAYRHWLATGEIVATLPYFAHAGSEFKTKIKLLPAWRLSQRSDPSINLMQGVRLNSVGAPIAYMFRVRTAYGDVGEQQLQATDALGRPLALHVYDGEPDQVRGITPFISILRVSKQYDQLADATLTAAIVQAIFAAVYKSSGSTDTAIDSLVSAGEGGAAPSTEFDAFSSLLDAKGGWYGKTDINLGVNGKIAHLFPGDELQFLRSEHPNDNYDPFTKVLLREMARPLAMTTEEFSGDWSGATYSSTRMSMAMNWPRVLYRRKNIVGRFHQAAYEAWLEEDIENGDTPLPGGVEAFLKFKNSVCRADWRGPAKPQADDTKAASAHETWASMGVLPHEVICSDLGLDVDDVYEQLAREKKRRAELGLPEPTYSGAARLAVQSEQVATQPKSNGNG